MKKNTRPVEMPPHLQSRDTENIDIRWCIVDITLQLLQLCMDMINWVILKLSDIRIPDLWSVWRESTRQWSEHQPVNKTHHIKYCLTKIQILNKAHHKIKSVLPCSTYLVGQIKISCCNIETIFGDRKLLILNAMKLWTRGNRTTWKQACAGTQISEWGQHSASTSRNKVDLYELTTELSWSFDVYAPWAEATSAACKIVNKGDPRVTPVRKR